MVRVSRFFGVSPSATSKTDPWGGESGLQVNAAFDCCSISGKDRRNRSVSVQVSKVIKSWVAQRIIRDFLPDCLTGSGDRTFQVTVVHGQRDWPPGSAPAPQVVQATGVHCHIRIWASFVQNDTAHVALWIVRQISGVIGARSIT